MTFGEAQPGRAPPRHGSAGCADLGANSVLHRSLLCLTERGRFRRPYSTMPDRPPNTLARAGVAPVERRYRFGVSDTSFRRSRPIGAHSSSIFRRASDSPAVWADGAEPRAAAAACAGEAAAHGRPRPDDRVPLDRHPGGRTNRNDRPARDDCREPNQPHQDGWSDPGGRQRKNPQGKNRQRKDPREKDHDRPGLRFSRHPAPAARKPHRTALSPPPDRRGSAYGD
jgi:hypothetical protein